MSFKNLTFLLTSALAQPVFAGDIEITQHVFDSVLRVKASPDRFAGAISSVTFRGKEYINSADHGRELQSASSFDGLGECFNPTEAGGAADGVGPKTASLPITYSASSNVMQTLTNMAFWLPPGKPYGRRCGATQFTSAQNTTVVSGHNLRKTVLMGYQGIPNVLRFEVAFSIPEDHQSATFEALTGYMPPEFSVFLTYDPVRRTLSTLSFGPGEQGKPVMLATTDGRHAMGVSSPGLPQAAFQGLGYGRFRFPDTNKWGCVFREGHIAAGSTHVYACLVAIGTVDEVIAAQNALYASGAHPAPLYRFFNGRGHFLTASYSEGTSTGYKFESTAFNVYTSNLDGGMVPIYRCQASGSGSNFASRDGHCEGQRVEGQYGFVSTSARAGLVALHRFHRAGFDDHLTTTNYAEGIKAGYSHELVLGYVPAQ